MQLYANGKLPKSIGPQRIFRVNAFRQWLNFLFALTIALGLFWFGRRGGYHSADVHLPAFILYWVSGVAGLVALFVLVSARASSRTSNWLLRYNEFGLAINYRSYLNHHFNDDDETVLSLSFNEIRSVRQTREKLSVPGSSRSNTETTYSMTFMDLAIADLATVEQIRKVLQSERDRSAPQNDGVRTKYKHYPVTITRDGVLRIDWNGLTPGIKQALDKLRGKVTVESEQLIEERSWKSLDEKDFNRLVIKLRNRGGSIQAIKLIIGRLGLSTTEAKVYIDRLEEDGEEI